MEVIRLAATLDKRRKKKFLCHISSVSVFSSWDYYTNDGLIGEKAIDFSPHIISSMGGYGASKRVAEVLVQKAINQGLSGIIFRPGETNDMNK